MAKLTVGSGGVDVADGVYEALCLHVDPQEPTEKSPNQKPWLKWTFTLYDGSPEGQGITAASSMALGPKAKARPWVEALLGRRLEPREEVDTDDLGMKECQLIVKADPETGFVRVHDVLAPRPRRPQTPGTNGITV
jgi:hypothetical protein